MLKKMLKLVIPEAVLEKYHHALAMLASFVYGRPSEKMIVIGITGTSGKSTASYMLAKILERAGHRVGMATTIMFKVGEKEWLNDKKMTMLGRFQLQKLLADMVSAGCKYAIVETTSEGIKQFRHKPIHYDVVAVTNLYPEHIESHGGFENYKAAKGELFLHLTRFGKKIIDGEEISRLKIVNVDDEALEYFADFESDETYGYGLYGDAFSTINDGMKPVIAKDFEDKPFDITFTVNGTGFRLPLLGSFNIYNALVAISVALSQGIELSVAAEALSDVTGVPGRKEVIDEGQDFTVIVDYAFEPVALEALYEAVEKIPHDRIIHVTGATGGGRDKDKRSVIGNLVSKKADVMIVTNEDPYFEDPVQIIDDIVTGATGDAEIIREIDRREAIGKAISLARKNDLVLITGKGSEQAMAVKGELVQFDDRVAAREALKEI